MKYRNDFVTNSSSSSFIISKTDDINETEKLFKYMKSLYYKWINAKEQMLAFCKENPDFVVATGENGEIKVKTVYGYKTKEEREKNNKLNEMLIDKFGVDYWDSFDYCTEWLSYETYDEYLKHTQDEKYISFYKKPFIILDFNNITEDTREDVKDIIGWYFNCYDGETDCEWCNYKDTDKCIKEKRTQSPSEFGNVCIYSESNYMPDFVVKELEKHCEFYCNHMG